MWRTYGATGFEEYDVLNAKLFDKAPKESKYAQTSKRAFQIFPTKNFHFLYNYILTSKRFFKYKLLTEAAKLQEIFKCFKPEIPFAENAIFQELLSVTERLIS